MIAFNSKEDRSYCLWTIKIKASLLYKSKLLKGKFLIENSIRSIVEQRGHRDALKITQ